MRWRDLPGPGNFIERVIEQVRQGVSTVVATPVLAPPEFERAITDVLDQDRWAVHRSHADSVHEPLSWLTDQLYIEPPSWVGWSVDSLFERLSSRQVIAVDGVTSETWGAWRAFLRDFEGASRRRAADERPVLLLFVRGVSKQRLKVAGAALSVHLWTGVVGELDMLVYVDQLVRRVRDVTPQHKLIVRQIAALALWDLELAAHLVEQPVPDLFDALTVLRLGLAALNQRDLAISGTWEGGGSERFDDRELVHPFLLLESDTAGELTRRVWTAQAAELLPQIEVRRRALVDSLGRHIPCPFWIDSDRKVDSLEELEIGALAYAAHTHKSRVPADMRQKVQWLADCRNALAHLQALEASVALDSRLHS